MYEAPIQYTCGNYPVQRRWLAGGHSPGGASAAYLEVSALTGTNGIREEALLCEDRYGTTAGGKAATDTSLSLVSYYQAESWPFTYVACSWE